MRRFGFILLVIGIFGFLYCSGQLEGRPPLPQDLELLDYLRQPAGRLELGRYVSAGLGLIGVLLALFPQGR